MRIIAPFILACLAAPLFIKAQETVSSAGGNATGSGGNVSYSIGQVFYNYESGLTESVQKGVQQPYEISNIASTEAVSPSYTCELYPIPSTNFIELKTGSEMPVDLSYEVYDLSGKIIMSQQVNSLLTVIPIENIPASVYFLKVINKQKEIRTFKIIKN